MRNIHVWGKNKKNWKTCFFFHVGTHFLMSEDSLTIEYNERALTYNWSGNWSGNQPHQIWEENPTSSQGGKNAKISVYVESPHHFNMFFWECAYIVERPIVLLRWHSLAGCFAACLMQTISVPLKFSIENRSSPGDLDCWSMTMIY